MFLPHARSLLFLPAINDRAIEKARGLDCDMVILDLEDAVPDTQKEEARASLPAAFAEGFGHRITGVRVNAVGSPHHEADMAALADLPVNYVVLPKTESAEQAASVHQRAGKPVIAMIESTQGLAQVQDIASAPAVAGLFMGNNDLRRALNIPMDADRRGLMLALQTVIFAARLHGKPVFDGVYNRLDNADGFHEECLDGRAIGFDGKTVIHPNQIAIANAIFGPSAQELSRAERLISAATGGAQRHEGQMIEAMHVEQARALLIRAQEQAKGA